MCLESQWSEAMKKVVRSRFYFTECETGSLVLNWTEEHVRKNRWCKVINSMAAYLWLRLYDWLCDVRCCRSGWSAARRRLLRLSACCRRRTACTWSCARCWSDSRAPRSSSSWPCTNGSVPPTSFTCPLASRYLLSFFPSLFLPEFISGLCALLTPVTL